jgi:CMP-2-keto-3-deoxyoctulosonic acid synthetase
MALGHEDIIVIVQGDEPFIASSQLGKSATFVSHKPFV